MKNITEYSAGSYDCPDAASDAAAEGFICASGMQLAKSCRAPYDAQLLMLEEEKGVPSWVIFIEDKGGFKLDVDEIEFVERLKKTQKIHYYGEMFFIGEDQVEEGVIRNLIFERIKVVKNRRVDTLVNSILSSLQDSFSAEERKYPDADKNIICFPNGTLLVNLDTGDMQHTQEVAPSLNRIPVNYDIDADCPMFQRYLAELIPAEEIICLQEYVGYCLLPNTAAQKALFIRGFGGEGKSVLGKVLSALFGKNCVAASCRSLFDSSLRFTMPSLCGKFLWMDTDLSEITIKETEQFKKIVTGETIIVDRKYRDALEMKPDTRLLILGNQILFDDAAMSNGLARRLLILDCKPLTRSENQNDKLLAERIIKNELSGVLNWALLGLSTLLANNFNFEESIAMKNRREEIIEESSSVIAFLKDAQWVQPTIDKTRGVSSADLYQSYLEWCRMNAVEAEGQKKFGSKSKQVAPSLGYKYSKHILGSTSQIRGFLGIRLVQHPEHQDLIDRETGEYISQQIM